MMVSTRTVTNWDGSDNRPATRPTRLHERILEVCVEEGTRDPQLYLWVHRQLEVGSALEIVTEVLERARKAEEAQRRRSTG